MRQALNENPLVQAAVIGVLFVVVGVIFMMNMGGGDSSDPAPQPLSSSAVAPESSTSAAGPQPSSGTSAAPPADSQTGASPSATPPPGALLGPGLPREVLAAYGRNDVIVLLVADRDGIEDAYVSDAVKALRGSGGVTTFVVPVEQIARYSRLTQGVNVTRAPAMVVVRPREVAGQVPSAQVYYGYRSAASVNQAVSDARFDGQPASYGPG